MTSEQINELFSRTLLGDYEDDSPWEAVQALRRVGSREVFDHAAEWCKSENPLARARGADVLAQLGKTAEHPTNSFPEESCSVVSGLLQNEGDDRPLASAIAALGHIGNPLVIPSITRHAAHPNAAVRFDVAFALGCFPDDPRAVEALLILMKDVDDDVRDWATFGLGVLGDADSGDIRDALFHRASDSNEDVREEAVAGLCKRKDRRVLPLLLELLKEPGVTYRITEAAREILDLNEDPKGWSGADYAAAVRRQFSL